MACALRRARRAFLLVGPARIVTLKRVLFVVHLPTFLPLRRRSGFMRAESRTAANRPSFDGSHANLLAVQPFGVIVGFPYLVAREKLLAPRQT
jgi:hypothetical protein